MLSLSSTIRNCRVSPEIANQKYSERFLNSNVATCPRWDNTDNFGRPVCQSGFYAKAPGCNSPFDIVSVENSHRPTLQQHNDEREFNVKPGISLSAHVKNSCVSNQHQVPRAYNHVMRSSSTLYEKV